jgi:hypothetical protein
MKTMILAFAAAILMGGVAQAGSVHVGVGGGHRHYSPPHHSHGHYHRPYYRPYTPYHHHHHHHCPPQPRPGFFFWFGR